MGADSDGYIYIYICTKHKEKKKGVFKSKREKRDLYLSSVHLSHSSPMKDNSTKQNSNNNKK